jgi:hypothetical protein
LADWTGGSSRVCQLARDIEKMGYIAIIGTALIALFSVTASAQTPSPGASGIKGTILVSPIRPGPIRKDDVPSIAPVRNAQFVVKAGDAIVATFTTDDEGRFQVALPPGHYVIVREGAAPRIGGWRFEADVVADKVTKVNWTADSGMR